MKWSDNDFKSRKELGEYYWEQGYFHLNFGDKLNFKRDFQELRLRDLSLFSLGEIKGKNILDVGCGKGLYTLVFFKMGAKSVSGQDILQDVIDYTKKQCEKNGYDFNGKVADCAILKFDDSEFDLAFSGDVFEHITDNQKEDFINEVYRVLKPGGFFTIKTPNKSYLKLTNLLHRIKAIFTFRNPFKIHIAHTKNNPDNEHHGLINHNDLIKILKRTMFHDPEITKAPLYKNGIPRRLSNFLGKYKIFNQHVIIKITKPIYYGIFK